MGAIVNMRGTPHHSKSPKNHLFLTNHLTTQQSEIISDAELEKERSVAAALELQVWPSPPRRLLPLCRSRPVRRK